MINLEKAMQKWVGMHPEWKFQFFPRTMSTIRDMQEDAGPWSAGDPDFPSSVLPKYLLSKYSFLMTWAMRRCGYVV